MVLHSRTDHKPLTTSIGELNYRDIGSGDSVVFVHGFLVNGGLWDDVVFYLPPQFRAVRPDFPLGGHSRPAEPNANLGLPDLSLLLLEIIDTLGLNDVTLVANEAGDAICRHAIVSTDLRAGRIARLLLTNCGSFDQLEKAAGSSRHPFAEIAAVLSTPRGRQKYFGALAEASIPDEQLLELLGGFLHSDDIRRDARKVVRGMLSSQTATPALPSAFAGPISIAWGVNDRVSPAGAAEKLANDFVNTRLSTIRNSRLLVPIDQPEMLANEIIDLLTCDVVKSVRTT
jgi:pimeloyl-ACP methyl ester carboxylesterase